MPSKRRPSERYREALEQNRRLKEKIRRMERAFEEVAREWEKFLTGMKVDNWQKRHELTEQLIEYLTAVIPLTPEAEARIEATAHDAHHQLVREFFSNVVQRAREKKEKEVP